MYFKPRIFISSLMSDKLKIRNELNEFFSSVGTEVLLYEKNLTPSSELHTYRKDILDSDFVIIILDNKYGKKLDSGLSGTEEEYNIACENKLKTHVYIKKSRKSSTTNPDEEAFLNRIKESGVSYFIYNNDETLLKRIKETTMKISQDIILNNLSAKYLSKKKCIQIASEYDYNCALEIITVYNSLLKAESQYSFCDSNVMIAFMERVSENYHNGNITFIDSKYYW